MAEQPWNKGKRLPPEPLSDEEVKLLIRVCSNRAPTGIRNRALIAVMWRCGLRVNEALALKPKDVDVKHGTIRVLHGKGDKARVVGMDDATGTIIQRWLDKRREHGLTGRRTLFCTLQGDRIATVYVRNLLRRLGDKAGIDKRVHPHGLRHTHASELAREGTPLPVIQQQLGHTSIVTTQRYIQRLNPQAVIDAMQQREWSL